MTYYFWLGKDALAEQYYIEWYGFEGSEEAYYSYYE